MLRLYASRYPATFEEATLIITALAMLKNPCMHPEMDLAEVERKAAIENIETKVWRDLLSLAKVEELTR